MIDRDELKRILHEKVVTVTFNKVDGEQRVMPCTLVSDMIPADYLPKHADWKCSDDVCSVWATDVDGWRSFRWDSVISFE